MWFKLCGIVRWLEDEACLDVPWRDVDVFVPFETGCAVSMGYDVDLVDSTSCLVK